ncbi:sugar phosphate isomerase/epimerase [Pedobacter sp. ISL-68]|jgi:sugar phosphate isomerase/epimerase|uniref:sugar phosphate isomerase/epimerase family protein n=1 Tax=unclassified Pedobacter TaxID=2628915 RepID=UPI001BE59676|nr:MULTISPECIES: sugar phosphate isomerase/epimerase [unclassified Pedobacter]MBT2563448.1 sugar phosphate isomerase/epimerase [Pedobacter sp. ISL-64]MBT2592932.1 sugar phosphate isomerase/epimerase [Pedobacter sp. ISL-68]
MLSRRSFILNSSMAAAAALLVPSFACVASDKKSVGLQLYSLRDELPKDVKGTIAKVAKAGFKEVETYGFSIKDQFWGLTPAEFKKLLDDNGLTAPSGHYGLGSYLTDGNTEELKAAIAAAKVLGSEYVTIPWLDESIRKSADDYKKIAVKINEAGKLAKEAGIRLAYHNHNFEFEKQGDTTGYEILLKGTDKNLVDFELDLYWVVRSGNDPIKLFKENPGRFTMWHVKDMDKANPALNAEVGTGSINFKPIFADAKLSGMKHFFIEHETNYKPNPMESVAASCAYIKKEII